MKAWGSKKIIRRAELEADEGWQVSPVFQGGLPITESEAEAREPIAAAELQHKVIDAEALAAEVLEQERLAQAMERAAALEQAQQSGFDAGRQEGYQAGFSAGEQAGRQAGEALGLEQGLAQGRAAAEQELAAFQQLLTSLQYTVAHYQEALAEPIVELALVTARQLLRKELAQDPASLVAVIRDALADQPVLQLPLRLSLHPDDLVLVQTLMASEIAADQWRLDADPQMARGGCKISSNQAELDLSLPTRWRRITEALGASQPWDEA